MKHQSLWFIFKPCSKITIYHHSSFSNYAERHLTASSKPNILTIIMVNFQTMLVEFNGEFKIKHQSLWFIFKLCSKITIYHHSSFSNYAERHLTASSKPNILTIIMVNFQTMLVEFNGEFKIKHQSLWFIFKLCSKITIYRHSSFSNYAEWYLTASSNALLLVQDALFCYYFFVFCIHTL
jgi:hypothetical protein